MSLRRRAIEVRGEPASFREAGSGMPAILVAGLGLTSRFYERSYAAFAGAGIRLIVPDLPGWGDTPGPHTGLRPERTAEFLLDFTGALGVRSAVWIGHSLGAQPVVEVAARRPDVAAGIVLVGPTGARGRVGLLRQLRGLAVEARRTSLDVIGAVAREYVSSSPARYIGTWLRHGGHDVVALLPFVQCPALILVGDRDPVSRPDFVELLRRGLRHARVDAAVEWVPGGTHALPRAHAAQFNRTVIAFVQNTSAAT